MTWENIEQLKREKLEKKINKARDLYLLEISLLESVRELVPPDFLSLLSDRFKALREGKEAPRVIFFRYKDDSRLSSLLEVVSAAYSYSAQQIEGRKNIRARKVLVSWSSTTDEDVRALFHNMKASKGVRLPN